MASHPLAKWARRSERIRIQCIPTTVWQMECLKKEDRPSSSAISGDHKDPNFHRLRILGPLSSSDLAMPEFFAEECLACTGKFVLRTSTATATMLIGNPLVEPTKRFPMYEWTTSL